jgi:ketosteroid isomerase-like protein
MIAEGDAVVEEWETFFYGLDGTMYNNHYCWLKQVKDGDVVQVREYLDSHHAFVVLGLHAPWGAVEPPRAPRRRWRPAQSSLGAAPLTEMETVFPIRQAFNLNPNLLRDVTPTANASERFADTVEGCKALVRAMRDAQAKGDMAAVNGFHGDGYRHFIAGEGPLGWEHLPLQELYAPLVTHLAGPIEVRFGPMVAEGGSVFEEMDILARLDDGTVYNNWHCFIHEIRGGRIVQTREYMDTHHLWVGLARWADWGKTPVAPLRQARRSNMPFVTASYQVRNPFLKLDRWEQLPSTEV